MADKNSDALLPKDWWKSKTILIAGLSILIGIATYFSDPLHTPQMTLASLSEAVVGVVMIVLRVISTQPIAGTPSETKVLDATSNTP